MKLIEKSIALATRMYIACAVIGIEVARAEDVPVIGAIANKCISSVFPTVAGIYFGWQIVKCARSDHEAQKQLPISATAFGATVVLRTVMKYVGG